MKPIHLPSLYPLLIAASLALFAWARSGALPMEAAVMIASAAALALGAWAERRWPYRLDWHTSQGDVRTDATSALVLAVVVDPLLKAALPLLAIEGLRRWLPAGAGFPVAVPFAAQVLLALLWIELAKYASHRLHHKLPALWWLHALHHSSTRLYWLNGLRFHPLNHLINTTLAMAPLWWMGAPAEVLLATAAITQPVLMLQHANLGFRHGWINRVFSTHELHRRHHALHADQADSNYGSALVVWDQVFGTWRAPSLQAGADEVGLFARSAGYPGGASYGQQLRSFFAVRQGCCGV